MTRRIFATTGILLAAALVACIALLAWVLGTQSGSRVLWHGVASAVDGLAAESFDGRLGGSLSVRGLQFETDNLRLTIGSLQLDWVPWRLLNGEVLVDRLHVNDVTYTQLQPAAPPDDSEPLRLPERLSLPVALDLRDVVLRSFEYRAAPDAAPARVDAAMLAAGFRGTKLSIDQLSAHGPMFRIQATATVLTEGDYPLTASLDWRASLPDLAPINASLTVDGDLSSLHLRQTVASPYNASQQIEVRDLLGDSMRLDALVAINDARLQVVRASLPQVAVSGTLRASGSVTDLSYQADLTADSGAATLGITGNADLSGSIPTFSLQGDWQDLSWPLVGEPRVTSGKGQLAADGSAGDYSIELKTALGVPGRPPGQLSLSGHGDNEAFELADLQLALFDGSLTGRGDIRWSPEIRGSLMLDGTFREQPLDVRLKGGLRDTTLRLDTLRVRSGQTHLSADGRVGETMDLQWDIDSPDLGDLLPGAAGSLAGGGRLAGSVSSPVVRGSLEGASIAYAGHRLGRLSLELDLDLERQAPSELGLTLEAAVFGDVEVSRLSVSGTGTRNEHQLDLQVDSSAGTAHMRLAGDLQDRYWNGRLTDSELQYADLAAWTLADPQPVRLGSDAQYLDRGCWHSGDSRLCLQGQRIDGDVEAALSLDAFNLAYLRSMIPDTLALAGSVDVEAGFQQQAGATPAFELTANANDVALRTGEFAEQPDELLLGLQPASVHVNYADAGLRAEVSMPFTAGGGIDGTARIDPGSEPLAERPLRGSLSVALDDIGFLGVLSSEIEQAAGALSGDLDISGTLEKPVPAGDMRLAGASLELARPGLDVSDIAVRITGSGGRLEFDGDATSGRGTLQLVGSATLAGAQTVADIRVKGDAFEVMNTVEARVFVSPDLQVMVHEKGVAINGEVVVPRAEITPKELPRSVITASPDEIIMDGDNAADVATAAPRELEAGIRIVLGDAVSIEGFGLKGRLAGGLTVTQSPGQPTLGSGEVRILDGEYRAYGQGLVIDTGKIVFAGGPISRPGINVRALRRPAEGIVVGVSARGPLQNPDFSVFSEPGMSQSEQLSWLVLGRPLDGASEGESNMIAQAALALGLKGGDLLAGRLGEELGVDRVGIETGSGEAGAASDMSQAAFVIGKYLSPDLFVSYGIGLFDSISTVRLEYTLTEHWKVSTESSTLSSGGDVTYTIER